MRIWIIGGGRFGRQAALTLRGEVHCHEITVIDKQQGVDLPADIRLVCADGVQWFTREFSPDAPVDMIIPALPVHLAAEWLKQKLVAEKSYISPVDIPRHLLQQLPNTICQGLGKAVVSHADFLCPTNCPEPEDICSYTRQARPVPLYQLIEEIVRPYFTPLILRSRQFAPGVGGFLVQDLWGLLKAARLLPMTPLLVGTACKCHGIIDGFSFAPK